MSNRLPFVLEREADGKLLSRPGTGGLVTALLPVIRERGGLWVGWPGVSGSGQEIEAALTHAIAQTGYRLSPVLLTAEEQVDFYQGFSNEIVWPLFHDFQSLCNFEPAYWRSYCAVNRKYARAVAAQHGGDDFVWVHDYHLMNVGMELRRLGLRARCGFFLHIPFPPPDIYVKLPWRLPLLHALLAYDLIGFQTRRDLRNFTHCVRALLKDVRTAARGQELLTAAGGRVRLGVFPIGIDFEAFAQRAATAEVATKAAELHALLPDRQLILGVDRLDYTKGVPQRLEAFRCALQRYPTLRERVTLLQVVVPSRADIPQYHALKTRIEQLVSEINGEFTRPGGWVPIHYVYRPLSRTDLIAYYRAAEIGLITPLKDGMNLIAKEYCACSVEGGALILSEFAGAVAQLQRGALLANPHDVEAVAESIRLAYAMAPAERQARMRRLRQVVRRQDVFWWVNAYLTAAIAGDISTLPLPADDVPRTELDWAHWQADVG